MKWIIPRKIQMTRTFQEVVNLNSAISAGEKKIIIKNYSARTILGLQGFMDECYHLFKE